MKIVTTILLFLCLGLQPIYAQLYTIVATPSETSEDEYNLAVVPDGACGTVGDKHTPELTTVVWTITSVVGSPYTITHTDSNPFYSYTVPADQDLLEVSAEVQETK